MMSNEMHESSEFSGVEFEFKKARYLVELTGQEARDLKEFVNVLEKAEPSTLFYHVYHPLLEAHLVPYEYPNDFSFWFSDSLQDNDLAEQVANIELPREGGLEELREVLLGKTKKALAHGSDFKVQRGNEFQFVKCRFVVYPTGFVARSIDELADGIASSSELCIFYHLVASRVFGKKRYDDFSAWILANTKDTELAKRLSRVDPTTHMNVRTLQSEVLRVMQKYLKEKRAKN
ncbi:MAG: DUF5752 family protein [Nitrososphaerales archaeon]